MTESKKLFVLREKLISRRREIVDSFQTASPELLNGNTVVQIQNAIDAVDRQLPTRNVRSPPPRIRVD